MSASCGSCVCSRPATTCSTGRLVLATAVDHTATALRSLGLRRGTPLRALAPGLLELRSADPTAFLDDARGALSTVEADEVRCLVADPALPDAALLAQAMTALTLRTAGASVGVAVLGRNGSTGAALLRAADVAMYACKHRGAAAPR